MKKHPLVWTLLMTMLAFSLNANAEYYVVYPASAVPVYSDCGCTSRTTYRVHHHHAKKYKRHYVKRTVTTYRRSSYHIDVYYIWYAYPGAVPVPPPGVRPCEGYRDYWQLQSRYATAPVVYEHDDDATYYAPDLDRSTADDVDYAY